MAAPWAPYCDIPRPCPKPRPVIVVSGGSGLGSIVLACAVALINVERQDDGGDRTLLHDALPYWT